MKKFSTRAVTADQMSPNHMEMIGHSAKVFNIGFNLATSVAGGQS